ncbi:MAG: MetQ/NlpA family ABC transporter substrate-binding protein [Oscillospiraceae bacterium]|jgi:D-methionine transport system substrate-binding protein|nr:MetQ/NlpA family ABC transporter substrate-binding protein [Oscillospiraceae bacterium]
MKNKKVLTIVSVLLLTAVLLTSCGKGKDKPADPAAPVTIKIGASSTPHAEILEYIKPTLAAQNITLEIVVFDDYVLPNTGVEDGSLDVNYFQHRPYLAQQNDERKLHLVEVAGIHLEPLGIYPGKTASLADIKDGATIAVPNDGSNEARALFLLEKLGLITLPESKAGDYNITAKDIQDNPHNIKIQELVAENIPQALPDVDFAVINGNYALAANLSDKVLERESPENNPYVNIIVVKEGNQDKPEIKALAEALKSADVKKFIDDKYKGAVIAAF